MRFVVAFLVLAGLWLVARDFISGERRLDGVADFLFAGDVDRDAPNWGDVAAKIGELADERSSLAGKLDEQEPRPKPKD
jgi:hypothetical protein